MINTENAGEVLLMLEKIFIFADNFI